MKTHPRLPRPSGFSLLEVLVAVVILSFGLLALSALQGTLFKTSSEAKAQSAGLALAQEKLEFFRGFQKLATYQAIDSSTTAETIAEGGINYSRTWVVDRCAYKTAASAFDCGVANTGALSTTAYAQNNEFKRIAVKVTWTDAQSSAQHVSLEEVIAALDPSDSAKIGKLTSGTLPRGPEVRIYDPSKQQQGVIPIAISEGTDTAATNPKPLVNGSSAIETRFDVLTYSDASDDGTALAQARTQTSLVGCSCDTATADAGGAKRPSYWDGTRYTEPENATAIVAGYVPEAGADASASTQSALCTICCRDHHDPATLPSGAPKFDPRNSTHAHFRLNATTGALTGPITSGKYTEACRVIRVGGLFRVAADMYDDYQNFLATRNDNTTTAYLPTAAATTNYQNFVKAYLDTRIVNQGSQSNWNDVLPISNAAGVTGLESANSIYYTQPDAITIQTTDTAKWLHLRGLYVDYLEDKARQAIADAKSSCTSAGGGTPSASDLQSCVLRVLPFTSINLTELGNYTPKTGTQIVVANNNFLDTLSSTAPVRGKVTRGTSPTANQITNALGIMRRSNSGLTTLIGGIDTEDATTSAPSTWSATQPYRIQGSGSSGGSTGGTFFGNFYVETSGTAYPFNSNVLRPFINSSLAGVTCNPAAAGNAYTCTSSSALGVSQTLTVGNYNYQTAGTSTTALTCSNGLATTTYAGPYATKICRNYSVTSVTVNGTAVATSITQGGTDGTKGETSSFTLGLPVINNTDVLGIVLGTPVDTVQPLTCSYSTVCKGNSGNCTTTYEVTSDECP
jgi:type IV pilus modification protein PilV